MWPHKIPGEGHFAAKLRKRGEKEQSERKSGHAKRQSSGKRNTELEQWNDFRIFCEQYLEGGYLLKLEESGRFVWRRERLYLVPGLLPDTGNLRIGRGGLYLGEAKKGR